MYYQECIRESTQLHTVLWHTRCARVTSRFAVALPGVEYE